MKKKDNAPPQPVPDRWLSVALRFLIGTVFLYAGFHKASAPAQEFAAVIEAYAILPPDWALPFAQILPWVEIIFGVYLVAGYWTRRSAWVMSALLVLFIGALLSATLRGIPLENCGCFGSSLHLRPSMAMAFDACLLVSALWLTKADLSRWSVDHWVNMGQP